MSRYLSHNNSRLTWPRRCGMWMGERREIPIGRSCFRYVFLIVICCSQQRQVLECVGGLPRPIQPVAEHAFFRRTEEAATSRYTSCTNYWPHQVLKVRKHWVQNCGCGRMSNMLNCVLRWRHLTWPGCLTWYDLESFFYTKCAKDKCIAMPKLAALRAAVFQLSAKNRWEGHICAHGRVRVRGSVSTDQDLV